LVLGGRTLVGSAVSFWCGSLFLDEIVQKKLFCGEVAFLRGVFEKSGRRAWCFCGQLWRYAWLAWTFSGHIFGLKDVTGFQTFFGFRAGTFFERFRKTTIGFTSNSGSYLGQTRMRAYRYSGCFVSLTRRENDAEGKIWIVCDAGVPRIRGWVQAIEFH
jgi:hypothetical protein